MTTSDDLRLRALAVPTRRRLFEILEQAPAPLSVADLASGVGIHQNTVRLHLDALIDASLVEATEAVSATGRGRPATRYRAIGVEPAQEVRAYERLAAWLAAAVTPEAARSVGHCIGSSAAAGDDRGADALVALLAGEGFHPTLEDNGSIVLHRCPFSEVAAAAPAAVCALHQGIVDGFADGGLHRRLVARDPRRAGCTITAPR